MPRISVVMPVCNGERFIRTAIDSVLSQSETDFELIVVDDGSIDGTARIVSEYRRKDPRVRLISRSNSGGAAVPKNDGIRAANGRYLCFLDHDDVYAPDRIRTLIALLEAQSGWSFVFHDLSLLDAGGHAAGGTYLGNAGFLDLAALYLQRISADVFECRRDFHVFQALRYAAFHVMSLMIDLDRVDRDCLFFDPEYEVAADTDLFLRLGLQERFGYLNQALSGYRLHEQNVTRNARLVNRFLYRAHIQHYARLVEHFDADQRASYRKKIGRYLFEYGYCCFQERDYGASHTAWRESLHWYPTFKVAAALFKNTARTIRQSGFRLIMSRRV